ncbi:MAG: PIG-L family deacetylase [Gammaproteobacteria bacterium]|nr:PIG-L family deacetylase [Gammaproteobacteria bacterium]
MLRPHGRPLASLLSAVLASLAAVAARAAPAPPQLPPLDAGTALLVLAPHPDDETLCCAGVIQRVLRAGGRASVVWLTSGDASLLDLLLIERSVFGSAAKLRALGVRRMREARAATALLGVASSAQLFLGYPDRGLARLTAAPGDQPYASPFTGVAAVPYSESPFAGHPYTAASLERDFAAILARVQPTLVLVPSPRDAHPDHAAAGLMALRVLARRGGGVAVRCWIVHGGAGWPSPRELSAGVPLTRAPLLGDLPVAAFALTPAEEDAKLAALRAYPTQMLTLAPFLLSFVRTTELFTAPP